MVRESTEDEYSVLENQFCPGVVEFLKIMTTEFGDDLDELRKKPDFTEKSLVILAKTLQLGVNMFDIDVLNGLIQESGNTSNQ